MFRKTPYLVMVLVLVLSLSTPALASGTGGVLAQEGAKSYIVVLQQDQIGNGSRLAASSGDAASLESEHDKSLEDAGASANAKVHDYTFAFNGYSAILTEDQVEAIKLQKNTVLVMEDQWRYPQTDSSPDFLGLTVRGGAYDRGYTGEGVVVGVIDTGIWPEHASFADDGSYPAPPTGPLPCDFGNTAHNPNDAPFTCNNKLIGAYQMLATYRALIGADPDEFDSARDDNGHGTHTASTAAGNADVDASMYGLPVGTISGIAPRAHIIAYKGLGNLGGFTSDLAAAIDQAVADGVDVINYSIGGGAGAPSADELAFLFAADAGVFVATSAGNSGPGVATVGNPATMPWVTSVGASTQSRFFEGTITLGNGKKYKGASLTPGLDHWTPLVNAASAGDELCTPSYLGGGLNPAVVSGKIVLCLRGAVGRADKSLAVFEAGGVGMILYNANDVDNLFTDTHWVPSVHIDNTPGLKIKAYIASASNPKAKIETRDDHHCDEGPDNRHHGHHEDECGPNTSKWKNAPTMTIFSSRGPNPVAEDIIKPDITAPGLQILAGNSPFPDPGTYPGELFQGIAGTSMSSPHVAGVYALLKQAHPEWSAAMAKSALMTTAYQDVKDNDRVSKADPFDMGSGHINPGGRWRRGSITEPGLVYDAGLFEYAAFSCGMEWGLFSPGSCAFLESIGVPSQAYNLNYPSIGVATVVGSQTVMRTVTSIASRTETFKAKVIAPAGYSVTVTPNQLTLNPGDSATFEVTITNNSAPVGEWRFGSLTWKGGDYKVYSPIAVKGALFDAPAEISGSGDSGSASFDVKFGYTGSYSAAPHGLVPATVTTDNVLQDPDQTFSPSDVVAGGANVHEFILSGVAHFRIAMPPEATEADADLDIFVFDPTNTLVATSTAGGTDELIDISEPMDGAWSVYVHGWSAPGGDSDYNMWTWAVPFASGGSLSVDSAPTSATMGAVETITVSWTGLTSGSVGDWYLGAVSHTGDTGLMSITLVNVDNRP